MTHRRIGRIGHKNYWRLLKLIELGQTANEIAAIFEVDPETIRKFARRRGLKIQRQDWSMENHPCWGGGTTIYRSGYELQRVEVAGPHGYLIRALRKGDARGYAPTHRIVMHDKLGRALLESEVVHHIDGDLLNNDPDNLAIFPSNADHLRHSLTGKVPNWTPEGRARMTGRRPKNQRP